MNIYKNSVLNRTVRSSVFALALTILAFATPALAPNTQAKEQAPKYSPEELQARAVERRAFQAAVWGMPAVNYKLMYDAMARTTKGDFNQVLYWSGLLNWKNQTLTPNPDVIYMMPFFDTKDVGPVVLEIPPADDGVFNGSIMNYWQTAIEDIGPGGVDKGKGGKYLFLPPDYPKDKIPDGYIPLHSDTYKGYALLRSVLNSGSDADVAKAVNYAKRVKMYPLSQVAKTAAGKSPDTIFVDAQNVLFDSKIRYDYTFFERLNEMVQAEPFQTRDKAMIDQLKTLGIERGKPFTPDAKTKEILTRALVEAHQWLDAAIDDCPPFYEGTHWAFPATEGSHQDILTFNQAPDSYAVDNRGMIYTLAFFSAKHIGESQYYLLTTQDKDGKPFDGASTYRVHVPANVPVKQYWSMTVYNRATHTFLENTTRPGRSSQSPGLKVNADGSVDLYFGPKAPDGHESNWTPTDPKGRFEILARFYGPTKDLYTKTGWKLPDLEKVK